MAHGTSKLIALVACGLSAVAGCTGTPKNDPNKALDQAKRDALLDIGPATSKPANGLPESVQKRFDRTTPTQLPSPQLTNPIASSNLPTPSNVGIAGTPTFPGGNAASMPLYRPQQPIEPHILTTSGTGPLPPAPLTPALPTPEPLPSQPPAPKFPSALPVNLSHRNPLDDQLPLDAPPIVPPTAGPAFESRPVPPLPTPTPPLPTPTPLIDPARETTLPKVPSFVDQPLGK